MQSDREKDYLYLCVHLYRDIVCGYLIFIVYMEKDIDNAEIS